MNLIYFYSNILIDLNMYYQILLLNSMDKDFQIIKRVPEGSSKYLWASKTQPDVDISKALPVNTADM